MTGSEHATIIIIKTAAIIIILHTQAMRIHVATCVPTGEKTAGTYYKIIPLGGIRDTSCQPGMHATIKMYLCRL